MNVVFGRMLTLLLMFHAAAFVGIVMVDEMYAPETVSLGSATNIHVGADAYANASSGPVIITALHRYAPYIPGESPGVFFLVSVDIESPLGWDLTSDGIVGWSFDVHVDPNVLTPWSVHGATFDYFLYDCVDWNQVPSGPFDVTNYPSLLVGEVNSTTGDILDVAEFIMGYGAVGVGAGGNSYPEDFWYGAENGLVELRFRSRSLTAYSLIDISNAAYYTSNGTRHTIPDEDIIDGHYNEPPPPRTLTIEVVGSGTTDPTPDNYTYVDGATVPVDAIPDSGWMLDHWKLDTVDVGADDPYTVTMDTDHTLTAVFVRIQHELTISVAGSGTTYPAPGSYTYDEGTLVSVDSLPDSGWTLDHWALDGVDVGSADPYSVTMDVDHVLTAIFAEVSVAQYNLTINIVGGPGTTDPPPGTHTYEDGTFVSVNAIPNSGWALDYWELDGVSAGHTSPYSMTMDADHTLTAVLRDVEGPHPYFTCSSTEPQVGETVKFDASNSSDPGGTIVRYEWDFGDGANGTGVTVTHTYTKPGDYSVVLKVYEEYGSFSAMSTAITVKEAAAPFPLWTLVPIVGGIAGVTAVSVYLKKKKPKEKMMKPAKLSITAEPTQILADGKARSTLTIRLVDEKDEPIAAPAATEVKLAATGGKLESPRIQVPKGKEAGKTFLVSSTESGTINVSANAKGLKSMAITLEFVEKPRFCMGCGNRMVVTAKHCEKCGASPQQFVGPAKLCKNCDRRGTKTYLPQTAEFCSECGASQPKQGE